VRTDFLGFALERRRDFDALRASLARDLNLAGKARVNVSKAKIIYVNLTLKVPKTTVRLLFFQISLDWVIE
jgi:hypothetical protein